MCTKKDANAQRQMETYKGRSAQEQVQWEFGELRREKGADDNRWE